MKNKIIVFWDNNGFDETLKLNKSLKICNNFNDFKALDDKTIKEAIGFIVLCELPWDDESAMSRTAFGGIRLVQRFIRKKMNLRAPVVFASLSDAKTICDEHRDLRIIKTPALKHFFKELPVSSPEELICLLGKNYMTDIELAYTKLVYCDMKGLLIHINHILEGRGGDNQEKCRKDIEYILQNQFNNDEELVKEYNNAKDLSGFCKKLLSRLEDYGNSSDDNGLLYEKNHDTIKILMIEDEVEKDGNVKRFVNYVEDIEQNAINKTELEIEELERKIKAINKDTILIEVENELINKTSSLKKKANIVLKGLKDGKEYKKLNDKIVSLETKIERLNENKKGEVIRQDLKKKKASEQSDRPADESIALECKAISLVQEVKPVIEMASTLVAIAMSMEKLAKAIGEDDLAEQAVSLGCKANSIKDRAKALKNQQFTKPLFKIVVEKNADNIECDPVHGYKRDYKREIEKKFSLKEFDVVISDIEIWDDNDFLATLGFNVVETMAKVQKRPLYYIVTNVSRSFYDQIKIPYVRRVRLKKEVFGTKESIETFLYGIKEVYDHREEVAKENETKTEVLFNKLYDYIKKDIKIFNIIENDVKEKSFELIKDFLRLFSGNDFVYDDGHGNNFIVFDANCKKMRENIKKKMSLNETLDDDVAKLEENNQDVTQEVIDKFVNRLILRRFFLYVRRFIDRYKIMESFDEYKKMKDLNRRNEKIKLKREDIACRAISAQYKTLRYEYGNERERHSQCLSQILSFATIRKLKKSDQKGGGTQEENLSRLTDEEQSFVKALNEKSFPRSKQGISKLIIDY